LFLSDKTRNIICTVRRAERGYAVAFCVFVSPSYSFIMSNWLAVVYHQTVFTFKQSTILVF